MQGETAQLLDIHGFSNEERLVLFVSERSGTEQEKVGLDLSHLMASDEYFLTYTELWDGGNSGDDPEFGTCLDFLGWA